MQAQIPNGTVLQNRYRLLQILGQGGFGRTYLAEDLGRFNERCAIKEFVPNQGIDRFSDKATELFQREAAILYQIQHPQIPQFRATFEQDKRLFLVQDYVEGTNYRDLLNQRRAQGSSFTEAEVRQFLQQILPVLAHIHAKGIIHRDISPDNLILRDSDRRPVLIDFGVVKEVVTRIQLNEATSQATTVGKLGYAPSEQMQTGRAYPSSDLYALSVTALVLLTGKEPQEMFDDVNLAWNWQSYVTVSPGLAQVLNKAINYRPGDRYQSVSEMAQALGASSTSTVAPTQAVPPSTPDPNLSQVRTVAVARAYTPTQAVTPAARSGATVAYTPSEEGSVWENPWAVTAIGVGLALVAGIGGWAVVSALNKSSTVTAPTPTVDPSIVINPTTTPAPTPSAAPSPVPTQTVESSQALPLNEGETKSVQGSLQAGETINYQIQGTEGQTLATQLEGEGISLTVLGPDGQPLPDAQNVSGWSGKLPTAGQYAVQISLAQDVTQSNYKLTVGLTAPEKTPPESTPTPTPTPTPAPSTQEQRVTIPQGQTSILLANNADSSVVRRYVVNVQQGQVLSARLSGMSGPVTLGVLLPGGSAIDGAANVLSWEGTAPVGGDFIIDVKSPSPAEFTLEVAVTGQP